MAVRTCVILRVWKRYMGGLEQQALGAPECCNQSSLGHSSVNAEQDRNANTLLRLQPETRKLLGTRLEAIRVAF